ncbi:MAG: hypothetical protein HY579_01160 [Nitrospinae bacterium]|nr:hypothetical protein [Nitrospinota bacterium]
MKHKLSIINFILVAGIVAASALIFKTWFGPSGGSKIDGKTATASARKFQGPETIRSTYSPAAVDEVVKKNLFRKDRTEYVPPPPPPPAPPAPPIPPPSLKINGVMLSSVKKIAVLEGTYSVMTGPTVIENKTLKKKGYRVGEQIGNYQITDVERDSVTLDNREGNVLKVNMTVRPPDLRIQRQGNHFFHKLKAGGAVSAAPSQVFISGAVTNTGGSNAPRAFISGAVTPAPAPASPAVSSLGGQTGSASGQSQAGLSTGERVSGAKTAAPQGSISGAPTAPAGARISGG